MSLIREGDGNSALLGSEMPDLMAAHDVPGCAICVLNDGDELFYSFGEALGGSSVRVTPETRFQACSISKPVSVFGALRMADQGVIALDEDVNDRLDGWRIPPNGSWQPRVTVRHLASHTGGLTTSGFPGYALGAELPSLVDVLSGVAPANSPGVRVVGVPGLQFRYSGGGTTVLQLLLESVAREPIAEVLDEVALRPCEMTMSTFGLIPPAAGASHAYASGHRVGGRPVRGGWHVYPESCAAGLWTTPTDLIRFARAVQDAAAGATTATLSGAIAEQVLSRHADIVADPSRHDVFNAIGLGVFLSVIDEQVRWFGHSGANAGFRCQLVASVEPGRAVAVMTNSDTGATFIAEIIDRIAARLGWTDLPMVRPQLSSHSDELQRQAVGRYVTSTGLTAELRQSDGYLTIVFGDQAGLRLRAASATTLISDDVELAVRLGSSQSLTAVVDGRATKYQRV